ncbi:uncharacterized protein CDAR_521231 [Caerostris darwini]|uniref:Uncharacterized protein n=1 Tax=Caerostris darwini TaxID=1538125 RepID=A0AAV4VC09_9ARAC|nr:uncharacterized protein CDAR_521231 [Caerostris darwini]
MYKKKITRSKQNSFKIPHKTENFPNGSHLNSEDNSKTINTRKRKLSRNIMKNEIKETKEKNTSSSKIDSRNLKKIKLSKNATKNEKDHESTNLDYFSNTEINNEDENQAHDISSMNKNTVTDITDKNKLDATSISISNSFLKSNKCKIYETSYTEDEIMTDINLILYDTINRLCKNEEILKPPVIPQTIFEEDLKDKNNVCKNDILQNFTRNNSNFSITTEENPKESKISNNNKVTTEIKELKILKTIEDITFSKIKHNTNESLRESNNAEGGNSTNFDKKNGSEANFHFSESNFSKVDIQKDCGKVKRDSKFELCETNVTISQNINKKQKGDNLLNDAESNGISGKNISHTEINNVNNCDLNKNNNTCKNDNSEFTVNSKCNYTNFSAADKDLENKNDLNSELTEICELKLTQKNENILTERGLKSDQLSNEVEYFRSDIDKIHKPLTILYMSALDYEKNFKITSSENPDEKSLTKVESTSNNSNEVDYQNFKISNPLRLLNISYNECSSTANNLVQCKILNDQDDMNKNDNLQDTNEVNSEYFDSQMEMFGAVRVQEKDKTLNVCISTQDDNDNINDLDKIKHRNHNLCSSEKMNIVSDVTVFQSEPFLETKSNMFNNEDFIPDKITFREKEENDETDVIPTGVFKHLNEIFEYNTKTTSIDVKETTASITHFVDEKQVKNETKNAENSYKSTTTKIRLGEEIFLISAKDCITPNNSNNSSQQDKLNFRKIEDSKHVKEHERKENTLEENILNFQNDLYRNIDSSDEKLFKNNHNLIENNKPERLNIMYENVENKVAYESINGIKENNCLEETDNEQNKTNEEKCFSDFEEYTEMDDDFNLTASQLLMLDADERMQSNFECNAISTGQQTDEGVISDIRNDAIILEIVDQLHSIK